LSNLFAKTEFEEIVENFPFLRIRDLEQNALIRFIFTNIFSVDHKVIAKQYFFTGLFWAFVGGFLSLIMRVQLGFPDADLTWAKPFLGQWIVDGRLDPEFYLSMVTIHGTIMVFFVLTSGFQGTFANYLIPIQIGARDMASGFINMLSYWIFFLSGVVLFYSIFIDTGANSAGWTVYPPLSALPEATRGSGAGITLWVVAMVLFIISNIFGAINFISTIINLRTKGMSLNRLPLSVWSFLFTAILGLLTFPVLLAALILLFFDRTFFTSFFLSDIFIDGKLLSYSGGSPVLFQHLFWFLGHPEVYIAIFPAFGIVTEVIATNSRKPIFGYTAMVSSILAIMILSFLVWAHHMFVSGMDPLLGTAFSLTSFIIAVPSSVKVFNWLATLWKGKIHFTPAMLFAIAMVSFFISGGLTGIFIANPPINMYVHDTYFIIAHFHLVMGSASFFGFITGIYYWYPKMFGKTLNLTMSYIHFWLTFIGVYLVFFPMHFMGLAGLPRRYYSFTYFEMFDGFLELNRFISIAAIITFAAQFIFIYNFFYSLFWGPTAPINPWRGTTLEWTKEFTNKMGNWKGVVPTVFRGPYDFSVPDAKEDFIPQNVEKE
jgi:cytochrome c oxidase subunit 1